MGLNKFAWCIGFQFSRGSSRKFGRKQIAVALADIYALLEKEDDLLSALGRVRRVLLLYTACVARFVKKTPARSWRLCRFVPPMRYGYRPTRTRHQDSLGRYLLVHWILWVRRPFITAIKHGDLG